jgi:hypothetical protein
MWEETKTKNLSLALSPALYCPAPCFSSAKLNAALGVCMWSTGFELTFFERQGRAHLHLHLRDRLRDSPWPPCPDALAPWRRAPPTQEMEPNGRGKMHC